MSVILFAVWSDRAPACLSLLGLEFFNLLHPKTLCKYLRIPPIECSHLIYRSSNGFGHMPYPFQHSDPTLIVLLREGLPQQVIRIFAKTTILVVQGCPAGHRQVRIRWD